MKQLIAMVMPLLLAFGIAEGQQAHTPRPDWADGYFRELSNSYIEVVSANGTDQSLARDKAIRLIVERRNLASGGEYTVHISGQTVNVSGSESLIVKARILDEYAEHRGNGDWRVYLLVQTCKNPTLEYDPVSVSSHSPLSFKTFIPGMTQLEKGQTTKALVMIGTEVALVGGIVAFEGARSSYSNKIGSTHNAAQKADYIDRANICSDMRNLCIAGAAAVYVWSFVDALVSKGPTRVMLGDASIKASPYASPSGFGLAMNIQF